MVTITLGKFETHLHSQWCFLAIKHTIAANMVLRYPMVSNMIDSDMFQNLQKIDNLTKFRNGFEVY